MKVLPNRKGGTPCVRRMNRGPSRPVPLTSTVGEDVEDGSEETTGDVTVVRYRSSLNTHGH